MSSGIYVATAGAIAQSNALDTTANNIANASTAGFRGERISFKEALGRAKSPDIQLVDGGGQAIDQTSGAMTQTGNPLDVALEGEGYVGVETEKGTRYTRAGNFQLDDTGKLVTADGAQVRGQAGAPIVVPPGTSDVAIDSQGHVSADGNVVGQLELTRFKASAVRREGATLYAASGTPEAGDPPKVHSGVLEGSNVNIVRGIVDLVKVSRTYESLMKIIQGYQTVESHAATTLGAPK
jgi:flagellar basal-body rod protein FlgF